MNKYSYIFIIALFLPFCGISSDTTVYISGQKLFRKNCSSCHHVHKELTGPMLASITKKRTDQWLVSFIKNSQKVILSKDPYAYFLFSQYNRTVMPSFENLTDSEINNILHYIEVESKVKQAIPEIESFNTMPGKELFRNHCLSCHQPNSEDYGPSLGSIYRRRPTDWIVKFVTNSQSVINEGDPYAEFLYTNFDKKLMPSFHFMDRQSIVDIIKYIDVVSKSSPQVAGVNGNDLVVVSQAKGTPSYKFFNEEPSNEQSPIFGLIWLYVIIAIGGYVLFIILRMLYLELAKSQK